MTKTTSLDKIKFAHIKDPEDPRDYTPKHPEIKPILSKIKQSKSLDIDLTTNEIPVLDQGEHGTCTANSTSNYIGWLANKLKLKKDFLGSRMHTYYRSRQLLNNGKKPSGDDGSTNRTSVQAIVKYGIPPEAEWPYSDENLNKTPSRKVAKDAKSYQALKYYRLDTTGMTGQQIYEAAIQSLQLGIPFLVGFNCYNDALIAAEKNGICKYPTAGDQPVGGHSVFCDGHSSNYGFTIDNSWGLECPTNPVEGLKQGHIYLDDTYFKKQEVSDLWCLINENWLNKGVYDLTAFTRILNFLRKFLRI